MNCCNPFDHVATGLTADGLLTVTNASNIANLTPFNFILAVNPNNIITGAPVNYTITVNGAVADVRNWLGLQISTDKLRMRRVYHGFYVEPEGETPYVWLGDTTKNLAYVMSSAEAAAAETGSGS